MKRSVLALAVALALVAPATAGARTVFLRDGHGANAAVRTKPFGVFFADSGPTTLLRSVRPGAASLAVPAQREQQYGTQSPPRRALYAPLSFLVGSRRVRATPTSQWQGTLRSVTSAGTEYRATDAVRVRRRGGGLDLVVATTDPSGRRLAVRVRPASGGGFRVTARPTPAAGVAAMAAGFAARPGEAFRGFGGRHDAIDQRGRAFWNWIAQENLASSSTASLAKPDAGSSYLFPSGSAGAYSVSSAFSSSRGFAFLLDRDPLSQWRMASDRRDAWRVDATGRRLSYVVLPDGRAGPAARRLTALTGRQPVPPKWALGTLFDRAVAFPSESGAQYAREVRSDLDSFTRYRLHVDGYRLEGWELLPRATLRRFIRTLRRRGIHPMLYFRAFVGQDKTGTDRPALFDEAVRRGYVATHADGRPYVFVANFNAPTALVDFTKPAARRWWKRRVTAALELGADGFMQDFGEQVMPGMRFADGSTGATMHNRYPVLFHRTTREAVEAFERAHPRRGKVFFFTRAGYSGTPGSAAFENGNFPGDETTDWSRASGLASQTPDMLNRAVGGQWGYTTDIGGYFDVYGPTSKELFLRWAQWAALSPLFRLHGGLLLGVHTPWSYDGQTVRAYKRLARLHARAVPLIARLWRRAERTGMPITRPLWMAVPGSAAAARQDQEWLLGRDVLVAPVVREGATQRRVWFPPGCWRGGGARHRGARFATVRAPLTRLPFFVRCGTRPLG